MSIDQSYRTHSWDIVVLYIARDHLAATLQVYQRRSQEVCYSSNGRNVSAVRADAVKLALYRRPRRCGSVPMETGVVNSVDELYKTKME